MRVQPFWVAGIFRLSVVFMLFPYISLFLRASSFFCPPFFSSNFFFFDNLTGCYIVMLFFVTLSAGPFFHSPLLSPLDLGNPTASPLLYVGYCYYLVAISCRNHLGSVDLRSVRRRISCVQY